MSLYTTEVRYICEMASGYPIEDLQINKYSPDQIIDKSWDRVLNFPWTFYNAEWKEKIGKFFLKYNYTREIGLETVALWKLKVNTRLEEIRGTYEPLIEAIETITADDYINNYSFAGNSIRNDDLQDRRVDNLQAKQYSDHKDKYSDTPQNGLTNVNNGSYLTDYRNIIDDSTVNNTGNQTINHTGNQKTDYSEKGYRGDPTRAEALSKIDAEKLNILQRIIHEFDDLFMGLWQ